MSIEHLVVANIAWLRRKAYQYCLNNSDAEDLVGETIEKILRYRKMFDSRKEFRPWALTVMRNTFITQYNRKKCVLFTTIDDDYCYISPYRSDQEAEISRIIATLRECAKKSIAIECVILYAKGYDYKEISQLLGIPKGTVMSRISNGRKMLRNALQR